MILIKKENAPRIFIEQCSDPNMTFDSLDTEAKDVLRHSLLEEQHYLCAYCMKKIHNREDVKIEHYVPRNKDNELDYHNLLAVCKGNDHLPYKRQTCDTRKGSKVLKHIDPQNPFHMSQIRYKRDGSIFSEDKEADEEINEILNLNDPYGFLLQNRKNAYDGLIKVLKKHQNQIQKVLRKLDAEYHKSSGEYEEYVGILRYFVEKKLRQYETN